MSALWAGAALPLAYAPGSIIERMVNARNQLMEFGSPPEATVVTAEGNSHALNEWGAPSWPADWFRKTVAGVYAQAEQSAPGEGKTAADIGADALDAATTAAEVVYESAVEVAKAAGSVLKETGSVLPWAIGLGLVLYLRK